jgi:redox-sensitive bicupin YhaK (pirin superfamily)
MDTTDSVKGRGVERLVRGRETADGAGVRLTRVIGHDLQRRLDPFLMLDFFRNDKAEDYMGGFPDHPHRGFETVTYMLAGRMRHHDSAGNSGLLGPGGAQWMTAASGLIHSELPEQEDGLMEGFQLWINLPSGKKMDPPHYRDIPPESIPERELPGGVRVRVLAGASEGMDGAVQRPDTEPIYLDIHLPEGASFEQTLPEGFNAFAYTYRGAVEIEGTEVPDRTLAILRNEGDRVVLRAPKGGRAIVVAARPLKEPIVAYGPFVMNTQREIEQAFADYQAGKFGAAAVRRD